MSEKLSKEVKVRKKHLCQGCGKEIQKGDKAVLTVTSDNFGIYNFYHCFECKNYLMKMKN